MKTTCVAKMALVGVLVLSVGCIGKTRRVSPDDSPADRWGDTETASQDVRTVADQMSRAILQLPQIQSAQTPPKIAFLEVKNNTAQYIDKELFLNKIRTQLMKNAAGKVIFLDRERFDSILAERGLKRDGVVGTAGAKMLLGVDYFLTGTLDSIDKAYKGRRATYTRYAFRLTDAESSAIVWEDEYEIQKVGRAGTYDR